MGKLINIDNGGTLTDIWVLDGDRSYHTKTITTPYDLSRCLFEGLKKVSGLIYGDEDLAALLQSTDHIRYSTTEGTNSLVTRKGPRLGLIIGGVHAADFVRGERQADLFAALVGERVEELVSGQDEEGYDRALVEAVNRLSSAGANRIVVSFEGSDYLAQEARFRRASLRLFPRHLLGAVPILYAGNLSSDPDMVRRSWTALFNAFLHPAMERFLYNAENRLRDYRMRNPLLIYRNDGYAGRVSKTVALRTYSSGPRAGMDSARAYAEYYGFGRARTLDVGGTTTDIGLLEDGAIVADVRGEVEGVECSYPLSRIVSIGVGGGSIFRIQGGAITVGPDSVGSAPGPACFGLGGKEATITDALLLMGLLDPATYFGGEMRLDPDRARAAVRDRIAGPLGVPVEEAVHAMFAAWAGEIAAGLTENAQLAADTALVVFGGGGPMGALAVAEAAGLTTVLVPRLSAVFSAHGIGFSDIAHAGEATLAASSAEALRQCLAELRTRVARDMLAEGFELEDCTLEAWLAAGGETTPIDVAAPELPAGIDAPARAIVGFRAVRSVRRAELPQRNGATMHAARVAGQRRLVAADGSNRDHPVIRVGEQSAGARGSGPAVIEEDFWTCRVADGWSFEFTTNGDVLFRKTTRLDS